MRDDQLEAAAVAAETFPLTGVCAGKWFALIFSGGVCTAYA